MLKKARTEIVFFVVVAFILLSIALLLTRGLSFIPLIVLSFGLGVWAISHSELYGFIKIRGMPRAGDPPRQFHPVQTGTLVIAMLIEVATAAYQIVAL